MSSINLWDKLYLRWKKIAILLLLLTLPVAFLIAQKSKQENLPYYDGRRIHYGFLMGIHRSYFNITYSQKFIQNELDSLESIMPPPRIGFDLGFIVNLRVIEFFDIRITPKVGFYEYMVEYNFKDNSQIHQLVEATLVDIPILLKYKSIKWGNSRIYIIGGIMPGYQASGNKKDTEERKLQTSDFNLNAELGFGFDFYLPLFKFSPEIRFSRGLVNMLQKDPFGYSEGIDRLNTNIFTFYLLFE
jgi:hypothetical protein